MKRAAAPLAALMLAILIAACGSNQSGPTISHNGAVQTWKGSGNAKLGTVHVPALAVVSWTCNKCAEFNMSSDPNPDGQMISLDNSPQPIPGSTSGNPVHFKQDTYHNVEVFSDGAWTLSIASLTGK